MEKCETIIVGTLSLRETISSKMNRNMAESESVILPKGVCQTFTPQQWRKTKCKLCFHDIIDHTKALTPEESEELIKSCMKDDEETDVVEDETVDNSGRTNTQRTSYQEVDQRYSSQSNYTQDSSKGSSDRLDVDEDIGGKDSENEDEEGEETDGIHTPLIQRKSRAKLSGSLYSLDKQDSMDNDDGTSTPNRFTQKRRTRSYRKHSSNLMQLSSMVRSSNSSLCSYNSELTDGLSDYDYDVRSVTDDTDDYAEITDVIDELEMIKPELKVRVENERRISRTKIFDLERELEGQQDYYRASEIAKDRQIKSSQREIEGLKLELSSVKAHENILALKSRLESEGKSNRIEDLEQQIQTLKDENARLSSPDITQGREDALSREVKNAHKRISHLEDENRALEERLKLAEDLQGNDRELLEVLRKQLSSMDEELVTAQGANRLSEDKLKHMETIRADFLKEQDKTSKLNKETEGLRQKIKRRDRHIEDLEDDNVKLQQLKRELESQLSKKEFKVKKMEKKVSELQKEVSKCNKEIADLTGENKTLEQVRRLTDLQLKGLTQAETKTEVRSGEEIFIHTLEDRLKHNETRVKELELENDNFEREIHEMYENLIISEKQIESYKEDLKDTEAKCHKLRQESKHSDKKIEMLHRKLLKSEKEKKRAINRQNNAEMKLTQYEQQESISQYGVSGAAPDDKEDKTSRMLRLKLQSTEAKLAMIEGNKGYLETKVSSLERKLRDKEIEITRLHDSLERDSGAPSQDFDRFDALERENSMLQCKLDDLMIENMEQKESLNQLKENNTYLEVTIRNLNDKLDVCTQRLKEVEEANHKLGREALRRTQSITSAQDEQDASINELKVHNKLLQEKIKQFDNVEELIERLEYQVKKEQGQAQWYHDENEHLKVKIAKMADTIRDLEDSKKEFEKRIECLSAENRELNNDVKRMEEKLEIYGDLFAKESTLYSSLKRRSVQSDRDEEKIIENALSPLMEEIKEKDLQIKELQKAVEEKNATITCLTEEIDLLESNLAAMVTERIKRLQYGESPRDSYSSGGEEGLLSLDKYRKRSKSFDSNTKVRVNGEALDLSFGATSNLWTAPTNRKSQATNNPGYAGRIYKEISSKDCEEMSVSKETFYSMLHQHEESLKQKDLEYYRSLIPDRNETSMHSSFYRTIESAFLDQYKDEDHSDNLDFNYRNAMDKDSAIQNKALVESTFEHLVELEDMIRKASSPPPNASLPSQSFIDEKFINEPENKTDTTMENVSSIDLSGLDDLLAEVNKRNSLSHEPPSPKQQKESETPRNTTKPVAAQRAIMPSIRTTKRRIIKLGGLGRSDSFDSATARKIYGSQSICSISTRSSTNVICQSLSCSDSSPHDAEETINKSSSSSTSSSTTSMASVIYIPSVSEASPESISQKTSSAENISLTLPPFRRPTLDVNKFLNSSSSDMN